MQYMLVKKGDTDNTPYSCFSVRKTFTTTQPALDVAQYSPNGPTSQLGGSEFACTEESYFTINRDGVQYPQRFWWCFSNESTTKEKWQINPVSIDKWYWAKFYVPKPIIMQSFGVDFLGLQAGPAKIRLYGSNDDKEYTLISNELTLELKSGMQNVTITSYAPYRYFKLEAMPRETTALKLWKVCYKARYFQDFIATINQGGA